MMALIKKILFLLDAHIGTQTYHRKHNTKQTKQRGNCASQKYDLANQRKNHFHRLSCIDGGDLIGALAEMTGVEEDRCGDHT